MRVRSSDTGRWATVRWDDVGNRDVLIVEVLDKDIRVYEPFGELDLVDASQVVELRSHLQADRAAAK